MEHQPDHIDNIFRRRLQNASVEPPPFVWPAIEKAVRKRKRRFAFWWLSGGLLVVAALKFMSGRTQSVPQLAERPDAQKPAIHREIPSVTPIKTLPVTQKPEKKSSTASQQPESAQDSANIQSALSQVSHTPQKPGGAKPAKLSEAKGNIETFGTHKNLIDILARVELPERLAYPTNQLHPPRMTDIQVRKQAPGNRSIIKTRKHNSKYCYDFSRHPNVWLADAWIGPTFSRKELTAIPDNMPYLRLRESSESRDWAFNGGLRLSMMLNGHFLLRTGLQYEQMTEVFHHVDPAFVKYIVETTVLPNGTIIHDTVDVQYGKRGLKVFNRFGALDIPLTVGAEVRSGRTGISINAGASVNLWFWKRGAILSPAGNPTYFTPGHKNAQEVFQKNMGISLNASAQWYYHLRPKFRVFAEPYFQSNLRSVTLPSHPVSQRYANWGIRFGVSRIID